MSHLRDRTQATHRTAGLAAVMPPVESQGSDPAQTRLDHDPRDLVGSGMQQPPKIPLCRPLVQVTGYPTTGPGKPGDLCRRPLTVLAPTLPFAGTGNVDLHGLMVPTV